MEQIKEAVKQILTKYLNDHKLRKTPERFEILNRIYDDSLPGHFDIEDLYELMRKNNYHVSRATLYNNMELLLECNLVIKHTFGSNVAQYERSYNSAIHHHLVCTACGKVKEFSDANIRHAIRSKRFKSFNISHYSLCLYGVCGQCNRRKKIIAREQSSK